MLRLAWIFGLLSTRDYDIRIRQKRFQPSQAQTDVYVLEPLEQRLLEDRFAVILFLLGSLLFAYTFLNAPV